MEKEMFEAEGIIYIEKSMMKDGGDWKKYYWLN